MVALTKAMVKKNKNSITVKTRLGWDHKSIKLLMWRSDLQDVDLTQFRFMAELVLKYYKEADWIPIEQVKNNPRMFIQFLMVMLILQKKHLEMKNKYGLDGAMMGRASIGNPLVFQSSKTFAENKENIKNPPTLEEKSEVARRHLDMSVAWKGPILGVLETRRHYTNYFKGNFTIISSLSEQGW